MAMLFILLSVAFVRAVGILKVFLSEVVAVICVVARAPAEITINGSIFHPKVLISSWSDWYLIVFRVSVSGENRSLQ